VESEYDLDDVVGVFRHYGNAAGESAGRVVETGRPGVVSRIVHEPVGVCALITPWNYPVSLLSWKLGPALATGCAVVVKPTQVTPLSPTAFCKALVDAGIPAGVISVLTGPGASLGETLIKHPLVAKVAMTGSSETGKRIMAAIGPHLKKVSLELGGQCPAIVCADADIDQAAKVIIYKGFRNMGQSCSGINRVYAHRSVHDALAQKLKAMAQKLTIGDGVTDPNVDLGPMATANGLQTTKDHIADAVSKGATVLCGGKAPDGEQYAKGYYYLPTILTGATRDMRVMCEETFGPVVPLVVFDDLADAIAQANDTEYGLVSYLFTRDMTTTIKVSEALEAGTVCVNHGAVNTNYGPYSGWKDSGYGTELSRKAVFEYLKTKHIKVQV
jgi:succinate-semialdehyde dehydrogenase / glutarate-semialdehyde dehydrogenase